MTSIGVGAIARMLAGLGRGDRVMAARDLIKISSQSDQSLIGDEGHTAIPDRAASLEEIPYGRTIACDF